LRGGPTGRVEGGRGTVIDKAKKLPGWGEEGSQARGESQDRTAASKWGKEGRKKGNFEGGAPSLPKEKMSKEGERAAVLGTTRNSLRVLGKEKGALPYLGEGERSPYKRGGNTA